MERLASFYRCCCCCCCCWGACIRFLTASLCQSRPLDCCNCWWRGGWNMSLKWRWNDIDIYPCRRRSVSVTPAAAAAAAQRPGGGPRAPRPSRPHSTQHSRAISGSAGHWTSRRCSLSHEASRRWGNLFSAAPPSTVSTHQRWPRVSRLQAGGKPVDKRYAIILVGADWLISILKWLLLLLIVDFLFFFFLFNCLVFLLGLDYKYDDEKSDPKEFMESIDQVALAFSSR